MESGRGCHAAGDRRNECLTGILSTNVLLYRVIIFHDESDIYGVVISRS
jgi:hypothetical protein